MFPRSQFALLSSPLLAQPRVFAEKDATSLCKIILVNPAISFLEEGPRDAKRAFRTTSSPRINTEVRAMTYLFAGHGRDFPKVGVERRRRSIRRSVRMNGIRVVASPSAGRRSM
jgi:hypothetical protein